MQTNVLPDNANADEIPEGESAPLLSIVTRSRKRKLPDYDDVTSARYSPLSGIPNNFESCHDHMGSPVEIKRSNLVEAGTQDGILRDNNLCDVIVRDILNDVVRAVVDDVISGIVDDAVSKVFVSGSVDVGINGVNDELPGTPVNGHDSEEINGVDIRDKSEEPSRISLDNKELPLIETGDGRDDGETPVNLDSSFNGEISNGTTSMINGHNEGSINQAMAEYSETIPHICSRSNEHTSVMITKSPTSTVSPPKKQFSVIPPFQNSPVVKETIKDTNSCEEVNTVNGDSSHN